MIVLGLMLATFSQTFHLPVGWMTGLIALTVISVLAIFLVHLQTPGAWACRIAAISGAVLSGYLFCALYLGYAFNNDLLLIPVLEVGIYLWAVISLNLLLIGGIGLIILGTCSLVKKLQTNNN